jgi:lipopolysaccharide export system permease protein
VRILNRYITQDFLVAFGMTLIVFTMVMCLGVVIKAIDYAARGLSAPLILKVFAFNIPYMLTFTNPMSTLTAALLLFGRMSFDGEISAMKASGLSLWQVVSPVIVLAVVFSGLCAVISMSVAPRLRYSVRAMLQSVGLQEPIKLIEAGRFIRDFPGLSIYVGNRSGSEVEDVVVYQLDANGPVQNIRAKRGHVRTDEKERVMWIDLYDVRMDLRERDRKTGAVKSQYLNAQHHPVKLDFSNLQRQSARKKPGDLTWMELAEVIRNIRQFYPELEYQDLLKQRMRLIVEASARMATSMSCFAFALIGVPLGLKSRRRESTVGILVSLVVVFLFYCIILAAKTLSKYPGTHADLVVWIPVIAMEIGGFLLVRRSN